MASVKHQVFHVQVARTDVSQPVQDTPAAPSVASSAALGPLMAGAWARGVADTLDMLGQGAVLLDAGGGVLFASPLALQRLEGALGLVSGHLVAREPADNMILQEMISGALAGQPGEMSCQSDFGRRRVRALPARQVQDPQMQLLKAFLIIE